jgi:hypothetical protein
MDVTDEVCEGRTGDLACWSEPAVHTPVRLCRRHLAAVAHQAVRLFVSGEAALEVEEVEEENLIEQAPVVEVESALATPGREVVYFLGHGSRIKIGYSTNLAQRVSALALRRENVLLVLAGDRHLERALHRSFAAFRVQSTEWFTDSVAIRHFMNIRLKSSSTAETAGRRPMLHPQRVAYETGLTYPDGSEVGRREWPDLYRVFEELCAEEGCATKETLTERGPFESRDTVRRALQVWLDHGVLVRKASRAEEFYLPATD